MSARSVVLAAVLAALPLAAHADGFGAAIEGGYSSLTNAKSSAEAVFDGSSGGGIFGARVTYDLDAHIFLGLGARYFSKDGSRVFVADRTGPVFPLRDEPLSVRIVPVLAHAGYRFGAKSLVPYVGIGLGIASYREESTVGGQTTSDSQTKFCGQALGGVEFGRSRFRVGLEAGYSFIPSTIGIGGVSKVYEETDVGGLVFVGRILYSGAKR